MRTDKALTTEAQSRRVGKLFCGSGLWVLKNILDFVLWWFEGCWWCALEIGPTAVTRPSGSVTGTRRKEKALTTGAQSRRVGKLFCGSGLW